MEVAVAQLIRPRDFDFLLYEVLKITELCDSKRYGMHDRSVFDSISSGRVLHLSHGVENGADVGDLLEQAEEELKSALEARAS